MRKPKLKPKRPKPARKRGKPLPVRTPRAKDTLVRRVGGSKLKKRRKQ